LTGSVRFCEHGNERLEKDRVPWSANLCLPYWGLTRHATLSQVCPNPTPRVWLFRFEDLLLRPRKAWHPSLPRQPNIAPEIKTLISSCNQQQASPSPKLTILIWIAGLCILLRGGFYIYWLTILICRSIHYNCYSFSFMYSFRLRSLTAWSVETVLSFRHRMQFPSSGLVRRKGKVSRNTGLAMAVSVRLPLEPLRSFHCRNNIQWRKHVDMQYSTLIWTRYSFWGDKIPFIQIHLKLILASEYFILIFSYKTIILLLEIRGQHGLMIICVDTHTRTLARARARAHTHTHTHFVYNVPRQI
jgi:hypothetical protein